jgi:hypothetical protein
MVTLLPIISVIVLPLCWFGTFDSVCFCCDMMKRSFKNQSFLPFIHLAAAPELLANYPRLFMMTCGWLFSYVMVRMSERVIE